MEKQKIKLNRKILSKEKECNIGLDIIVPDIKPDIIAIMDTNANSYIYKAEISNGRVRLDGNVDGYVVYLSENGETRSLTISMDFIETIEDDKIKENMKFKSYVKLTNIEAKILNERKISISAKINLYCEFFEDVEFEFLKDIEEDKNIQKLEKSYKLKNIIGGNKAKASLKEDMVIDATEKIAEILKTEVIINNIENKVSYNKVLSKADANIKIVYQTEEMNIGVLKSTYPVMSFIDIENVSEENICEADFLIRNMLFKIDAKEANKILAQIDFEAFVDVYETQEITIIQDMYSLSKEIDFTKKEIDILLEGEIRKEILRVNEKVFVEDISSIIDVTTNINVVNKIKAGAYINYELEVSLDVIYEVDNKNGINFKNIKIPCMIKLDSEEENVKFEIIEKAFNLNNEEIYCNIEIDCKVCNGQMNRICILENIEEKECEINNEYSMVVYFVKPCDTIWEIAKSFKVTTESIIQANNLENPAKINVGEKLYIVR